MLASQIALVVISTFSLFLNSTTLFITGYRLKFAGIDLILLSLVAIFDLLGSTINIARLSALKFNWFVDYRSRNIWCTFDSTLALTLSQTTFEIIAILSALRYLKICHSKQYSFSFWIGLLVASFLTSFGFNLGNNFFPDVYIWNQSALTCFPTTSENAPNMIYFLLWDILCVIRISTSLIIITFCYFNIAKMCQKLLREKIRAIELEDLQQRDKMRFGSVDSFEETLKDSSKLNDQIKLLTQLKIIHLQLLIIILAYVLSLGSVIFIIVYNLTLNDPLSVIAQEFLELLSWTILIINPLFVLISHEPSHRELTGLCSKLFRSELPSTYRDISIA